MSHVGAYETRRNQAQSAVLIVVRSLGGLHSCRLPAMLCSRQRMLTYTYRSEQLKDTKKPNANCAVLIVVRSLGGHDG